MADYYASARSNYFKVKNEKKFTEWCNSRDLTPYKGKDKFCFVSETYFGSLPFENPADCNDVNYNFLKELSEHLAKDEVAILMEVGSCKMNYLHGEAIAINSKNEQKEVRINEIYEIAKSLGKNITLCEY